jgi:hypothetical protein
VIRRKARDTEGIGSLKAVSALDPFVVVNGAAAAARDVDELIARMGAGIRASLENPSRLHGLRAESMFRAVLVALGGFRLLVEEDEGQMYFDDAYGPVKLPDYRAVDGDGEQVLVEVKTVPPGPGRFTHSIRVSEVEGLRRYGELTGVPVSVAHYWSGPNLWTLIDLQHLRPSGNRSEIEIGEAMRFNQMRRFGDRIIATKPPLELRLRVDEHGERGENVATVEITELKQFAAGEELVDEFERRVAFLLLRFGRWQHETLAELGSEGRIQAISLKVTPPPEELENVENQGFAMVGILSSMYSALFNEATLDDAGAVQRLDHYSEPGEFGTLIPSDYPETPDQRLRLWIFDVQPADS